MYSFKKYPLVIFSFILLDNKEVVYGKICDGGYSCSGLKTCCDKGCCYPDDGGSDSIVSGVGTSRVYTGTGAQLLLMPLHWYFWALLAACLAAIICLCVLWRRRTYWPCFRGDSVQDHRSEPDSNGSFYAPPHYSRCSSFHHAPPPYTEVATKPDMYPLVISYGLGCDNNVKTSAPNYLMVQYFHNYIFQPRKGSLSATSTVDSLNSNFFCTNNESNIIPPPYSCTESFDDTSVPPPNGINNGEINVSSMYCSDSTITANEQSSIPMQYIHMSNGQLHQSSNSDHFNFQVQQTVTAATSRLRRTTLHNSSSIDSQNNYMGDFSRNSTGSLSNNNNNYNDNCINNNLLSNNNDCLPCDITVTSRPSSNFCNQIECDQRFTVANSITGSDISSFTNVGTPDSPPRATSPTVEIREILDKIQQLPQDCNQNVYVASTTKDEYQHYPPSTIKTTQTVFKNKPRCFMRNKIKTFYVPLMKQARLSNSSLDGSSRNIKRWISRSAPATPCTSILPSFPSQKKGSTSNSRRDSKQGDGNPLLFEQDISDDERKSEHV